MRDFRVPLPIFCEYAAIMKQVNSETQMYFLEAMDIKVREPNCKVDWETFIELNTLLRYETATPAEYADFFTRVMDPSGRGNVSKEMLKTRLFDLFKGQFQLSDWSEQDDVSLDIGRMLQEKGVTREDGSLDVDKFREGLLNGHLDMVAFKNAMK